MATGTLPSLQTLLVPDARTSIEGVTETQDHLFITLIRNVKGQILQYAYKNNIWTSTPVDLPQTGSLFHRPILLPMRFSSTTKITSRLTRFMSTTLKAKKAQRAQNTSAAL